MRREGRGGGARVPVPVERIEQAILLVRDHKVMLDADLARLYGVETKTLNRAVKRNLERFPADFMFQLTDAETANSRCQFVTSSSEGHRPLTAYVRRPFRREPDFGVTTVSCDFVELLARAEAPR